MVLIGEATLAEEIVEQELLTAVQAILMEDGSLFGEMFEPVTLLVVHVMLLIGDATGSWEMVEQDMSLTPHGACWLRNLQSGHGLWKMSTVRSRIIERRSHD